MPRQAQLVLTRMLRIFDLIAKKHGIRYWLYRGTLLGAERHNGHVPFDTDVDIAIQKLDFEKFVSTSLFSKIERMLEQMLKQFAHAFNLNRETNQQWSTTKYFKLFTLAARVPKG